jgi:hypothetical protein
MYFTTWYDFHINIHSGWYISHRIAGAGDPEHDIFSERLLVAMKSDTKH